MHPYRTKQRNQNENSFHFEQQLIDCPIFQYSDLNVIALFWRSSEQFNAIFDNEKKNIFRETVFLSSLRFRPFCNMDFV